MKYNRISFDQVDALSSFDKLYNQLDKRLSPFYKYPPNKEGLIEAINNRNTYPQHRETLVEVLTDQYQNIDLFDTHKKNILSLRDTETFTVTTAHQLNILTGPLYYIYKILTTIKLAHELSEQSKYRIIPIFVLGGEDHDFDEVNHTQIYNKGIKWDRNPEGAVGRMSTEGLEFVLGELYAILGETQTNKIKSLFDGSYLKYDNYAVAAQKLVAELFKDYDLLVLNMDDLRLKSIFEPIIIDELTNFSSKNLVEATAQRLDENGIKVQVNPRDINLFYHLDGKRTRITFSENKYHLVDTDRKYSLEEISKIVHENIRDVSPNVILRPLYQELILPNICYVGGGGELAYWMELESLFAHHHVAYPVLMRRESALWIDKRTHDKINGLNLSVENFFQDTDAIIRQFIEMNSKVSFEFKEEQNKLNELFSLIKNKGQLIDKSISTALEAEHVKWNKSLGQLESRLVRAEKKKNESAIDQIRNIKNKLFPNNGLQERKDNFLPLYITHGQDFFTILLDQMDPFGTDFLVIAEE